MKRIALLTVLLLVVGLTAGFAIDVKPTLTLTGTASVWFGYDLDQSSSGFLNTSDASFTLSLLAADGTDTHAGTGAAYGSITLSNIEFYWTDSGTPVFGPADADISAKLVITPFEIGVFAAPGMTQDFFGAFEDADAVDLVVDTDETTFGMAGSGLSNTNYGSWITATFGPAAITVKVLSNGSYTGTTNVNLNNEYALGAEAVLTFAPLTVSAGGYMNTIAASTTSFYGKVALDMAPIVAWGAVEVNLPASPATMELGGGGGLTFTLVKDTTLAATAWYGDYSNGLDLSVVFTEPEAGLIPMLDAAVTFNLLDVADTGAGALNSEYELKLAAGYKLGLNSDASQYARPYLNFTYGSQTNDATGNLATAIPVMNAEVGLQLAVIPLTVFTFKWVSGAALGADLASNPMLLGTIQAGATVTY